ncbi:MAG TPA: FecR domain-containing protein [Pyrinomonadaceae bacterium]
MKNKELDNMLDKVATEIRGEQIDSATVNDAAARVWMRMSSQTGVAANEASVTASAAAHIESCADFQSLMPAYVGRELSEARALLLVDHTHECIPCRRALKEARTARVAAAVAPRRQARKASRYSLNPVILRWGIAATLVIGLGLVAWPFIERYMPIGSIDATVQAADGAVYLVEDAKTQPLASGAKLARGQVIRTAKDARAVVRLGDGTLIEMKDRSEFSVNQTLRGTTIHLGSGSVIVEAARQKDRLFLDTGDSLVAVTGTIFSANAGTKGSRVSVVEGSVNLDHNGKERVLKAGEQAVTSATIQTVPVKEEVAWSRNAAKYSQTLEALSALNKELNAVAQPGVRYSTRLLDMMPENTVLYAAVPNLAATIIESNRIIEEKIQQNPALSEWFKNRRAPGMNNAIAAIRDFGEQLGEEIAVGAAMDEKGEPVQPLILAELKNATGFRAFVDAQVQKLSASGKKGPEILWIDDPLTAQATATDPAAKNSEKQIYVWINGDVLVGSPKLDQLQRVATTPQTSFTTSAFRNRIADVYREGAGIVVAADLEKVVARVGPLHSAKSKDPVNAARHDQALNELGVTNLNSFVLDQKQANGKTHTRAVLAYDQTDRGITSWLAQPGPMGSLEYISPDANLVAGFVIKNPTAVVDDLLRVINSVSPDVKTHLDKLEREHGLNVRNDFAAPLGGEYAFAIDGPILPTPSWKLVIQVNDPARLQQTLERVVVEINNEAAKEGKKGLVWERADSGGRTFYTLKSQDFGVEANYVFVNGYMIAGPTRALIEQALRYHDSGSTLKNSAKFTAGLPADGNVNFSAFVYQNLAPLVQPFAKAGGNLPSGPSKAIAMAATMEPTLLYAYAYGDHIEVAANTEGGPFGLSPATLLGMPNAFELHRVLEHGMKK